MTTQLDRVNSQHNVSKEYIRPEVSRSCELNKKLRSIMHEKYTDNKKVKLEIPDSLIMNNDREDIFEPKKSYNLSNDFLLD
jgi:hypothetical protein